MTITKIITTTMNKQYDEYCYSLMETIDRVAIIQQCDNVLGIEVISMETGEVLYHEASTGKRYVAEALIVDLAKEVLDQGLTKPLTSAIIKSEREVREMNKELLGIITGLVVLFGVLIATMLWVGGVI